MNSCTLIIGHTNKKRLLISCWTEYYLPLQPITYYRQKMKKNSKKSILLLSIGGGLFICLISIYLSRNMLLQSITNKRTTHIEQTYGLQIHYQNLQMKGCSEITLQGLSIVPNQRDTLLTLQSVNVRLNFWKLLKGNIEVRNVHMNGLAIAFIKRDSAANYDW